MPLTVTPDCSLGESPIQKQRRVSNYGWGSYTLCRSKGSQSHPRGMRRGKGQREIYGWGEKEMPRNDGQKQRIDKAELHFFLIHLGPAKTSYAAGAA